MLKKLLFSSRHESDSLDLPQSIAELPKKFATVFTLEPTSKFRSSLYTYYSFSVLSTKYNPTKNDRSPLWTPVGSQNANIAETSKLNFVLLENDAFPSATMKNSNLFFNFKKSVSWISF